MMKNKHLSSFKKASIFIVSFFLLIYALGLPFQGLSKYGYEYIHTLPRLLSLDKQKDNTCDYFFVGNSLAWAGYSPIYYEHDVGYKGFNLATSGQPPIDSYFILKKALTKQKPKVVVLEINGFFNHAFDWREMIFSIFPLFNYHAMYRFPIKADDNPLLGFNGSSIVVPYTKPLKHFNIYSFFHIENLNIYYLNKIKDLCDNFHIKLILVSTPSIMQWCKKEHDLGQKWTKQAQVSFYDFNLMQQELNIDWALDSRDGGDHLNLNGEAKVRKFLAPILKKTIESR